jgi:hypothetical protein
MNDPRREYVREWLDNAKENREVYTVRSGETLRSIALRHPMLNDHRFWPLLAKVNALPTQIDNTGRPVELLQNGQKIFMPTHDEINSFNSESTAI